jgi:hypothetical protein
VLLRGLADTYGAAPAVGLGLTLALGLLALSRRGGRRALILQFTGAWGAGMSVAVYLESRGVPLLLVASLAVAVGFVVIALSRYR